MSWLRLPLLHAETTKACQRELCRAVVATVVHGSVRCLVVAGNRWFLGDGGALTVMLATPLLTVGWYLIGLVSARVPTPHHSAG